MSTREYWRLCSSCKSEIAFTARYWTCSVSTCNRSHTALVFCSVPCWEAHVPTMRHRDAWAEESRAPDRHRWEAEQAAASQGAASEEARTAEAAPPAPRRRIVGGEAAGDRSRTAALPRETLIVASKLKSYVKAVSGMNTSDRVLETLSEAVRELCMEAIENARAEGRKTVLDRDFPNYRR